MRRIAAMLFLTLTPAFAQAGEVDGFTRKFFGRKLGPGVNYACFARVHDAARLARHPR